MNYQQEPHLPGEALPILCDPTFATFPAARAAKSTKDPVEILFIEKGGLSAEKLRKIRTADLWVSS